MEDQVGLPYADYMARKVIKYTKNIRNGNEYFMWCKDCQRLPVQPVTGACGHTRCNGCIEANGPCPCGANRPVTLHRNVFIEDLLSKMTCFKKIAPRRRVATALHFTPRHLQPSSTRRSPQGSSRYRRQRLLRSCSSSLTETSVLPPDQPGQLCLLQARFDYARELMDMKMFKQAAPHLAFVAASMEPFAKRARSLLATAIAELRHIRHHNLLRVLYRLVRTVGLVWPDLKDLECVICYEVLRQPVTTPCGHSFCRCCIERVMFYTGRCPLCSRSLGHFDLLNTADTRFLSAVITAIDVSPAAMPTVPDGYIPIFTCAVAYPGISCPLMTDPSCWWMIRRILQSDSRKLGVVAFHGRNKGYSMFGTIVEVRDCINKEDGTALLSTIGGPRFQIIDRVMVDGCHMAQVQVLKDVIPRSYRITYDLEDLAQQIYSRAMLWLETVDPTLMAALELVFGVMPLPRFDVAWWMDLNGPSWLWWIVAVLPLSSELQVLMLSTPTLLKRLQAVLRTMELMHENEITPTIPSAPNACHLDEELFVMYHNQLG